jgi:homocysteine S-methyltransferase
LEADGKDLSGGLWSARLLLEEPDAIKAVHRRYLDAGAGKRFLHFHNNKLDNVSRLDVIATSTYQASLPAFMEHGGISDPQTSQQLFDMAMRIAFEAREEYLTAHQQQHDNQPENAKPLIAASLGSYGAYLADGSEYTGNFKGATEEDIVDFHLHRMKMALETHRMTPGID